MYDHARMLACNEHLKKLAENSCVDHLDHCFSRIVYRVSCRKKSLLAISNLLLQSKMITRCTCTTVRLYVVEVEEYATVQYLH